MKSENEIVQKLVRERDKLRAELQRHEEMAETVRLEEAKLMATANLHDEEQFRTLSNVRLRRELLPAKIRGFEEAIAAIDTELAEATKRYALQLSQDVSAKEKEFRAHVVRHLPKRATGVSAEAMDVAASQIIEFSETGAELAAIASLCGNTLSVFIDPATRPGELFEAAERLKALKF